MGKNQSHTGIGDNIIVDGNLYLNNAVEKLPSILTDIVNLIANDFKKKETVTSSANKLPDIEVKIDHNKIVAYKSIIHEYTLLNGILFNIYDELESEGTPKKNNILRYIHSKYQEKRGALMVEYGLNELEVAQKFSDEILKHFIDTIKLEVANSSNIQAEVELIDTAVRIIVVDGFINCKILERPTNASVD